jgi:hypothetical protein
MLSLEMPVLQRSEVMLISCALTTSDASPPMGQYVRLACLSLVFSLSWSAAQVRAKEVQDSAENVPTATAAVKGEEGGASQRRSIVIGKATEALLSSQHSGTTHAMRPIDGEQARRSYARYLKSFESEIPVHYKSGIDTGVRN